MTEELPLLSLRDGVPDVVDTEAALAEAIEAVAAGTGPVGIDAERASGYRYSQRAYLIQLRREGSGTWLIDPIAFDDLAPLDEAISDSEWILHAATQDLACLREVGLDPNALFDTELAGRLLGYPKVGLASLVEHHHGTTMKKEHSAADWSKRPLPESWLEYAALDVEVLTELRESLAEELVAAEKDEWARQEFEWLTTWQPAVRDEPWRRTSAIHKAKGRRALGAVRELWLTRDRLASAQDVAPGRLLPDAAIIAAARALPRTRRALLSTDGFRGRGARRHADEWVAALERAATAPEDELPVGKARGDGPPPPRAWRDRNPQAADRLEHARAAISALSEERQVPAENLLTPDFVRRVMWEPPADADALAQRLRDLGARQWQIDLVSPLLLEAIDAAS